MRYSDKIPCPQLALHRIPAAGHNCAHALAMAARKRRQDELLDAALLETFPASDPISVMRIM